MRTSKEKMLSPKAKELSESYNKKIEDLKQKKIEALKKLEEKEKAEKLEVMQEFMEGIEEIYGYCDSSILHELLNFIRQNRVDVRVDVDTNADNADAEENSASEPAATMSDIDVKCYNKVVTVVANKI